MDAIVNLNDLCNLLLHSEKFYVVQLCLLLYEFLCKLPVLSNKLKHVTGGLV